ncbi:MAG: imidazole glycerol phosphate synthase subunit HisH [Erysipelotrichaceae bacterium]|nr:imidazole glycerol phosphate synthase subunit HisH [Erysipelotrichaceae bacterium]
MIAIIDYHVGNLGSVTNAFKRLGMDVAVTRDHDVIRQADGIILPGVGSFPVAMKHLEQYDLIDVLNEVKDKGTPIMGICLGMQILFETGYEFTTTQGLGFLSGTVELMQVNEKLPHMGWNQLIFNHQHPVLNHIEEEDYVYFVHSYAANCPDEELIAYCEYGGIKVPAIVGKDNVLGCQFHPEKSGEVGKMILKAFKEIVEQ